MDSEHKVIIFDSSYKEYLNNRILQDPELYGGAPGASWIRLLYELSIDNGWSMITSDLYLEKAIPGTAYLISEAITPNTSALIAKGVIPLIIFSGESPNVDLRFFFGIKRNTRLFKHCILFGGLKPFVDRNTIFHEFYWPNDVSKNIKYFEIIDWHSRKFMVMVSSNKQRIEVSKDKGFIKFRQFKRQLFWTGIKIINPLFRFKDLYSLRLDALDYFSKSGHIHLYGKGWGNLIGLDRKYVKAIKSLRPKEIENKQIVLTEYKFSLCFENCIFPGYITEKIFDCFFSGTIPIYYGAPDIKDFIPEDCFIDYRSFEDFNELHTFLIDMQEDQISSYLKAISSFLKVQRFEKFSDQHFSNLIHNIIDGDIRTRQRSK